VSIVRRYIIGIVGIFYLIRRRQEAGGRRQEAGGRRRSEKESAYNMGSDIVHYTLLKGKQNLTCKRFVVN
jgi:hypothetical protein